jgi:hypothetical protein
VHHWRKMKLCVPAPYEMTRHGLWWLGQYVDVASSCTPAHNYWVTGPVGGGLRTKRTRSEALWRVDA